MRKYINMLFVVAAAAYLVGCSDDRGDLSPSGGDIDWYRVEDGSNPVQHLRHEIYEQYGTNVLYTDTIGSRMRTALGGSEVQEYKIVDISYWITYRQGTAPHFFLSADYLERGDMGDVTGGLEFTRDYVLPLVKPAFMPLSFLLCDRIATLNNSDVRGHFELPALYSLNTTLIGELPQIAALTEREKRLHAGHAAGAIYAWHIANRADYGQHFEPFRAMSNYVNSSGNTVSRHGAKVGIGHNNGTTPLPTDNWLDYGFLRYNTSYLIFLTKKDGQENFDLSTIDDHLAGFNCPTFEQDMAAYIACVLAGDDQWFYDRYEGYGQVIAKYDKMKELLTDFLIQFK